MSLISWEALSKSFGTIQVLNDHYGRIDEGDIAILTGPSGSGKSTLLNILGLLEQYDGGDVYWWGETGIKPFSRKAEKLLATKIGYLFQNFALIEEKTVGYNLGIVLDRLNLSAKERRIRSEEALQRVGLEGFFEKHVYACSGGEQQRVAIARLWLKPCELILCDEPTGSLDDENKKRVLDLLLELHSQGKTLVIASHDEEVKRLGRKMIQIKDLKKTTT